MRHRAVMRASARTRQRETTPPALSLTTMDNAEKVICNTVDEGRDETIPPGGAVMQPCHGGKCTSVVWIDRLYLEAGILPTCFACVPPGSIWNELEFDIAETHLATALYSTVNHMPVVTTAQLLTWAEHLVMDTMLPTEVLGRAGSFDHVRFEVAPARVHLRAVCVHKQANHWHWQVAVTSEQRQRELATFQLQFRAVNGTMFRRDHVEPRQSRISHA